MFLYCTKKTNDIPALSFFFSPSFSCYRLNSVESGLCMSDMETILSGEQLPSAVHLAKVETSDQLAWFAGELNTGRPTTPEEPCISTF